MILGVGNNHSHMGVHSPDHGILVFCWASCIAIFNNMCEYLIHVLRILVDGRRTLNVINSIWCVFISGGLPRHWGQWQNVLAQVHSSIEPGSIVRRTLLAPELEAYYECTLYTVHSSLAASVPISSSRTQFLFIKYQDLAVRWFKKNKKNTSVFADSPSWLDPSSTQGPIPSFA